MNKIFQGLIVFVLFFTSLSIVTPISLATERKNIEVSPLSGDFDSLLENNSDRGLRHEVNMDVETGKGLWKNSAITAIEQLDNAIKLYEKDQPKLAQVYFYLTGYREKDLDQQAFDNMNKYFEKLREYGIKAVLRFAYVWDDGNVLAQEPTTERVVRHLEQLSPWLETHKDQITVLQAGLIGAWGEWDSGARSRMNEKKILDNLLENTPKSMQVQVRYMNIKNNNIEKNDEHYARVSYHDDFLIGVPHGWNTAGENKDSAEWRQMSEETKNLLVDGEMIWGATNPAYVGEEGISGLLIAQRMAEHHFTSLSITHNYKEDGPEKPYSMVNWQSQYINQRILDNYHLPYQPEWFIDQNGNNVPRTIFEYIKQHLGYRVAVKSGNYMKEKDQLSITLTMENYGFSAPIGLEGIYIVLLDKNNKEVARQEVAAKNHFQSMTELTETFQFKLQNESQPEKIAILLKNRVPNSKGNRLSNELSFENGYNILVDGI